MKLASILPSAAVIVQIANLPPRLVPHLMPPRNMHTSNIPNTPRFQTMAAWFLVLLFAWCLAGCKTTRQTSSSEESERNAVSLRQWRYALSLSSDSIHRLTALSLDSCTITFGATDKSATLESGESSRPQSSASSGKPHKRNKAKPSASTKATPSSSLLGTPTRLTIYGLHFAQSDETKSVSQSTQSDSLAKSKQSSHDKSKQQAKAQAPFIPIKLIALAVLIMAVAIIILIRRYRSAR